MMIVYQGVQEVIFNAAPSLALPRSMPPLYNTGVLSWTMLGSRATTGSGWAVGWWTPRRKRRPIKMVGSTVALRRRLRRSRSARSPQAAGTLMIAIAAAAATAILAREAFLTAKVLLARSRQQDRHRRHDRAKMWWSRRRRHRRRRRRSGSRSRSNTAPFQVPTSKAALPLLHLYLPPNIKPALTANMCSSERRAALRPRVG